jgi:hypothetical protein
LLACGDGNEAARAAMIFGKPKPPHISTESVCPACGNPGCELQYDPPTKKIIRICRTCKCVVTQRPIATDLFEK